ncbi:MAG: flippase-like domain-containing protein [Anaerolineae bacterium]|nr:flippase-like domain-containing protein [Anaerolineae bacterium]
MENANTIGTVQPVQVEKAKSNKKQFVLNLLKIVISVALIVWILWDTNLTEIFASITSANLFLVALAGTLHMVGFTISAYRWRLLLRTQGTDAKIPYLIRSYVVSMFFNNFLPSTIGGDTIRAYDSYRLGKSKTAAVAVIFVDRFLGLLALMLFAVVSVFFADQLIQNVPLLTLWVVLGVAGMLTVVWLIFMPSRRVADFIANIHFPFFKKLKHLVDAFLAFQGRKDALLGALALSMLLQANVVFHYYLIAKALGLPIPLHSFFLIIPLVTVLMMLPISVNAIGIRENAFVFFFAAYGVLKPEAVAFAWIAYGLVLIQGILGGIVYAFRK